MNPRRNALMWSSPRVSTPSDETILPSLGSHHKGSSSALQTGPALRAQAQAHVMPLPKAVPSTAHTGRARGHSRLPTSAMRSWFLRLRGFNLTCFILKSDVFCFLGWRAQTGSQNSLCQQAHLRMLFPSHIFLKCILNLYLPWSTFSLHSSRLHFIT